MRNVIINGKKYIAEDGAPLKEILSGAGFYFPCGGNGKCGKCRVVCKEIAPTELDYRFLTESAIKEGVRVACDKKADKSLDIECEINDVGVPTTTLRECSVAAVISDSDIEICIMGDEPVETVVKRNPLSEYSSEEIVAEYGKNPTALTNALRAVIGKESVELFEKYGAAKASVTGIAAKGLYLKILAGLPLDAEAEEAERQSEEDSFGLPTESLYILPVINDFIGGEILAETVLLKEGSLLIDCEKTVVFYRIGENDDVATAIWDCDYSPVAVRCIKAAAKFLLKEEGRYDVFLTGRYSDEVEEVLTEAGISVVQREKKPESVASAVLSFRVRSKLTKEKNRTTAVKIYDNELFQSYLTEG